MPLNNKKAAPYELSRKTPLCATGLGVHPARAPDGTATAGREA